MNTPVQPPPPSIPPAPPSAPAATTVPASIVQAPTAVSDSLAAGTPVSGTVVALLSQNQAAIRTEAGSLRVQLPEGANIPRDATVSIQLDAASSLLRLIVQQAPQSGTSNPAPSSPTPAVIAALTQGTVTTATFVQSAPGGFGQASLPFIVTSQDVSPALAQAVLAARGLAATVSNSQPGGLLTLQSGSSNFTVQSPISLGAGTSVTLSPNAGGPQQSFVLTPASQSSVSTQGSGNFATNRSGPNVPGIGGTPNSNAASQTGGPNIQNGTQVPVRIASIAPPGGPPPQIPAQNSSAPGFPILEGTVTGHANPSTALVRTAAGLFTVPAGSTPLPEGSRLLLEVAGPPSAPLPLGSDLSLRAPPTYQVLQEVIALVQQSDPALARQITQALLPNSGPQMGPALLFMLQAVAFGNTPRWLGNSVVRNLEQLRRGSMERLDRELASLRGRAVDGNGGEWRTFQLPVLSEGAIEPLRLYIKDQKQNTPDEDDNAPRGQRFVVEVNFTRLGPYQFDTMIRQKHLDLMIRTHTPVPEDMRRTVHDIFASTVQALGMTGNVGYHVAKNFDLKAQAGSSNEEHQGLTV